MLFWLDNIFKKNISDIKQNKKELVKQYSLYMSVNGKCNITQFIHVVIEKHSIYNLLLFKIIISVINK